MENIYVYEEAFCYCRQRFERNSMLLSIRYSGTKVTSYTRSILYKTN